MQLFTVAVLGADALQLFMLSTGLGTVLEYNIDFYNPLLFVSEYFLMMVGVFVLIDNANAMMEILPVLRSSFLNMIRLVALHQVILSRRYHFWCNLQDYSHLVLYII